MADQSNSTQNPNSEALRARCREMVAVLEAAATQGLTAVMETALRLRAQQLAGASGTANSKDDKNDHEKKGDKNDQEKKDDEEKNNDEEK